MNDCASFRICGCKGTPKIRDRQTFWAIFYTGYRKKQRGRKKWGNYLDFWRLFRIFATESGETACRSFAAETKNPRLIKS
jgi:hypothetical protein